MSIARYYSPTVRRKILSGEPLPEWLAKHPRIGYIVACTLSYPPWLDRADLEPLRKEAQRLTKETGILHVLDHHPIPVTHPYVCGLTVPWNLRVVPWRVNASKGNKWMPDQLELL